MTFKNLSLSFLPFVVFAGLFAAVSCSPNESKVVTGERSGSRNYKLDPEAAGIQISVYGAQMGTPDMSKFMYLMKTMKNAGDLISLIEKRPGTEGGITLCGIFSNTAKHQDIYDVLRSIETDTKHTDFSAVSVSECGSDK